MCKQTFYVIGMTDGQETSFPDEVRERLAQGKVFSGGKRHREIVGPLLPEGVSWIDITVPLDSVFAQYEGHPEIVVFASGDPLFYGFAATLQRRMPEARLVVYPTFHSLQLLAHRLLLPYQDLHPVSLTGRPWNELDEALISGERLIGVLTDRRKTPAAIARRLLDYGYDNYRMLLGERLGHAAKERVRKLQLSEAATAETGFPNCLLLERTALRPRPFGLPESEFHLLDGRVNMITKMPIRLLTLSQLDLRHRHTFWDIGFCTGSVSIEAKLQFPHLQVVAFEQREEGRELIEQNARKFGTPGIQALIGDFLEANLSELPRPEAVFIGGHGGRLADLLRRVDEALLPGGVIVFNSVSADSLRLFEESLVPLQRRVTRRLAVTVDSFNPITILKAE